MLFIQRTEMRWDKRFQQTHLFLLQQQQFCYKLTEIWNGNK